MFITSNIYNNFHIYFIWRETVRNCMLLSRSIPSHCSKKFQLSTNLHCTTDFFFKCTVYGSNAVRSVKQRQMSTYFIFLKFWLIQTAKADNKSINIRHYLYAMECKLRLQFYFVLHPNLLFKVYFDDKNFIFFYYPVYQAYCSMNHSP